MEDEKKKKSFRNKKKKKKKKQRRNKSRGNERGGGGGRGPCGDSEVFSHSARSASVAVASSGTPLLQDKD